jgi:hypothetical protein
VSSGDDIRQNLADRLLTDDFHGTGPAGGRVHGVAVLARYAFEPLQRGLIVVDDAQVWWRQVDFNFRLRPGFDFYRREIREIRWRQ